MTKTGSPSSNLGVFSNGEWTHVDEQCHTAVHERVKRGLWQTILFMEGPKSRVHERLKNPLHQRFCWWSGFFCCSWTNLYCCSWTMKKSRSRTNIKMNLMNDFFLRKKKLKKNFKGKKTYEKIDPPHSKCFVWLYYVPINWWSGFFCCSWTTHNECSWTMEKSRSWTNIKMHLMNDC